MHVFPWIATAFSMILGLGVARLLNNAVNVFLNRARNPVHWVPLVWAASILFLQVQYWWAVIELSAVVQTWTIGIFLTLFALALMLFVAAALVLPNTPLPEAEGLLHWFRADGRWALAVLALFVAAAIAADGIVWGTYPNSWVELLQIGLILLPLLALWVEAAWVRGGATVAYLLLSLWVSWELSPKAYS